jgi:hypothetical protein
MKTFCTGLVLLALAGLIGCSGEHSGAGSAKVGGPGATASSDRSGSIFGPKEGEFSLHPDKRILSTKVKQGASEVVTIDITRGKNFDEDVALSFSGVPDKVTLDPKETVIKKGQENAKVTVKAGDDAGLGDHEITVTGKPTKGEKTSTSFKITVEKK